MRRALLPLLVLVVVAAAAGLVGASGSTGHPERPTTFPDPRVGHVPKFRSKGPALVVCKAASAARLRHVFHRQPRILRARLATLRHCRFRDIQAAVNQARSNYRILVMPGVYQELPSRRVPFTPKKCADQGKYFAITEGFDNHQPPPAGPASNDAPVRPNARFQHDCPNARNLIAVIGTKRYTGELKPGCDTRCNLQIQGMGSKARDVQIIGDRQKMDVIRADRADGFAVRNLTVQEAAFNGIDIVEANGFRVARIIARWNQNYGILSFTTDHGLYENITAYGNGDSGVYPGSDPKGCSPGDGYGQRRYGMELRGINSYGNTLGYSGTAGNSTWIHNSHFHDNASGISTDSFASGHPGMPQECAKWEKNRINGNNFDLFNQPNQQYCASTPFAKRTPLRRVCPQFQAPEGSGIIIYGGNRDLIRNNAIYDNRRSGIRLFYIPASIRDDNDPADQQDTSNGNRIVGNRFGRTHTGAAAPNGHDITWDGAGKGNCQEGNTGATGASTLTYNGVTMPGCPGSPIFAPGNLAVLAEDAPCAAWDPKNMTDPPGCDWFHVSGNPR